MEESGESLHQNVIEQSSITNTSMEGEELKDLPEPEDNNEVIYDPNIINNYVQKIAQLEEENIQLLQKNFNNNNNNNKFTFEYDLEVKDQILPLVVTAFKDKETGFVRLNKSPATSTKKKGL